MIAKIILLLSPHALSLKKSDRYYYYTCLYRGAIILRLLIVVFYIYMSLTVVLLSFIVTMRVTPLSRWSKYISYLCRLGDYLTNKLKVSHFWAN